MSGRFASITADLLARKGTAMPSAIAAKPVLDWAAPVRAFAPSKAVPEPMMESHLPGNAHHGHRDDAHYLRKIQIGLSDHDHERLRILSARKETSRQQIVREALGAYFEKQAHEYNDECRCLSGTGSCKTSCRA
jgi:hypothetical protein